LGHQSGGFVFVGGARVKRLLASRILGTIRPGEHCSCTIDWGHASHEIPLPTIVSRVPIEREGTAKIADTHEYFAQFARGRDVFLFANFRIAQGTEQRVTSAFGIATRRSGTRVFA
jgi:hypothetical protein